MKVATLFGNQLKIVRTLNKSERTTYKQLLAISLLSVFLEFVGIAIIYVLLLIVFEPALFLENLNLLKLSNHLLISTTGSDGYPWPDGP